MKSLSFNFSNSLILAKDEISNTSSMFASITNLCKLISQIVVTKKNGVLMIVLNTVRKCKHPIIFVLNVFKYIMFYYYEIAYLFSKDIYILSTSIHG